MAHSNRDDSSASLATLQLEDFSPHVGTQFSLRLDDGRQISVELVQTTDLDIPSRLKGARRPFSLLFRAPADIALPQRIYELEHAEMSKLSIFLVPIGPDEIGQRYEAVFN